MDLLERQPPKSRAFSRVLPSQLHPRGRVQRETSQEYVLPYYAYHVDCFLWRHAAALFITTPRTHPLRLNKELWL
jgi:hypothetical protein